MQQLESTLLVNGSLSDVCATLTFITYVLCYSTKQNTPYCKWKYYSLIGEWKVGCSQFLHITSLLSMFRLQDPDVI